MITAAARGRGQRWLPLVVLAAVALLWACALAGPFQFDDYNVIVDYPPVHSLAAWWQAQPGLRPLLKLSYALNWTLSPSPVGFHLFNLLAHLLNGALLLAWARRVLPLRDEALLLLMALWLLHPVQTEAVTYIAGRSMVLSTTCLLAALLALAGNDRNGRFTAALFTLLGLAVRETAWVFPLVLALVEYLRGRSPRECLQRVRPAALVVVLAGMAFLLEPHYRQLIDHSFSLRDAGIQWRAQVVGQSYLLQQLFSLTPNIDPDLRVPSAWTLALIAQAVALLALLLGSLYITLRHRSWKAAGLLWYFLLLLPTNSFMPRVDLASERHLYAALIGPLWSLLLWLPERRLRRAVAAMLIVLFGMATLIRNEDYRSELGLWARTAEQSPAKARVWNNLGLACRDAGDRDCAAQAFTKAMWLAPDDPRPAVNLYFLRLSAPVTGQ